MKHFLAVYLGTEAALNRSDWRSLDDAARAQKQAQGVAAWMAWGHAHANAIVDRGTPLGKTKHVDAEGIADTRNTMTGYVIVRAESHAAAAAMFTNHPHFAIFPGDSVEIMECLPLPSM